MIKYVVNVWGGLVTVEQQFISSSRNSKKHIAETGADYCNVYTMQGQQLSAARRWGDGKITNVSF